MSSRTVLIDDGACILQMARTVLDSSVDVHNIFDTLNVGNLSPPLLPVHTRHHDARDGRYRQPPYAALATRPAANVGAQCALLNAHWVDLPTPL